MKCLLLQVFLSEKYKFKTIQKYKLTLSSFSRMEYYSIFSIHSHILRFKLHYVNKLKRLMSPYKQSPLYIFQKFNNTVALEN